MKKIDRRIIVITAFIFIVGYAINNSFEIPRNIVFNSDYNLIGSNTELTRLTGGFIIPGT